MDRSYVVHIYAVVRVPVWVHASSPTKAARKAELVTDLYKLLSSGEVEYSEQITGFLVDEIEDGKVLRSFDISPDDVYTLTPYEAYDLPVPDSWPEKVETAS